MTIVDSYLTGPVLNDQISLSTRYQYMMYDIEPKIIEHVGNLLLGEKTLVMYSGSWRLNFDATYIELRMMKNCSLNFHKSTLFVEPKEPKLVELTLKSIRPDNIAIIHSDYWVGHQPIEQLIKNIDNLVRYVQPGGQVICTVPLIHVNFNRLTTTYHDLGFDIVDDSIVIVRK